MMSEEEIKVLGGNKEALFFVAIQKTYKKICKKMIAFFEIIESKFKM